MRQRQPPEVFLHHGVDTGGAAMTSIQGHVIVLDRVRRSLSPRRDPSVLEQRAAESPPLSVA